MLVNKIGLLAALIMATPGLFLSAAPVISDITDNRGSYPSGRIPCYEKLEITFAVTTVATNLQWPYDENPPPGIKPGKGVTVNALFSCDNWQTVSTQPAFYYQEFEHAQKSGRDWIYPTANFRWKARFSPHTPGSWSYKLTATDASGRTESASQSFSVVASANPGFIRVSKKDPRYFEYDNGTYFPALGYNMNFDRIGWNNPILDNQSNFKVMGENGIQLIRFWLSQWGIWCADDNPWRSMKLGSNADAITLFPSGAVDSVSEASMVLEWDYNPAMFLGWMKQAPACKPGKAYKVTVRYSIPAELKGPRVPGHPYGLIAKIAEWHDTPWEHGTCTVVSTYATAATTGWSELRGGFQTRDGQDFLDDFYLVLENIIDGSPNGGGNRASIDRVNIQEDLGGGKLGPTLVSKPWMAHHQYFEQRNSFSFDKVLELAGRHDIYFKVVVMEKNDQLLNCIGYSGNALPSDSFDNKHFYGNWGQMTKVRWLQHAWWRYLQARWGYSPAIHSWELLNEGDPFNGQHYSLADIFAKTMRAYAPNHHLVTTSFWHSFPLKYFWKSAEYPNLDYADVHQYVFENSPASLRIDDDYIRDFEPEDYYDTPSWTWKLSSLIGAKQAYGCGKPVMRGETGLVVGDNTNNFNTELRKDTGGVWLHNYIWGGINAGGLIESYWYEAAHICPPGHDQPNQFGNYYRFIKDIPLNNGHYRDASALVSDTARLRAWGQKDLTNNAFHLWVQNKRYHWKNVTGGVAVAPASGTVALSGFAANQRLRVETWDTWRGVVTGAEDMSADASGNLAISVTNLSADKAFRTYVPPPSALENASERPMPPVPRLTLLGRGGRTVLLGIDMQKANPIEVLLANSAGKILMTLFKGTLGRGFHRIPWGVNGIPSGVYCIILREERRRTAVTFYAYIK